MLRRVLTNVTLLALLLGLGAATWRYWQGGAARPVTVTGGQVEDDLSAVLQGWLISPTGGPVAEADVRAYLLQDRAVDDRMLTVTMTAPLTDLLVGDESLPDPVYFDALAEIRAPLLAERLCPVLSASLATRCTVASAHLTRGRVDPATATAAFRLEIYYSEAASLDDLPDLARHVLDTRSIALAPGTGPGQTVETALEALLRSAAEACAQEAAGQACRVLRMSLDFSPGQPATGRAVIGALVPLPETMRAAPELTPAPATIPKG
jgi:hypothetical protein